VTTFFGLIINVLIVVALVAMILLMFQMAYRANSQIERFMRFIAAAGGALAVLSTRALGLSVPEFLMQSLSTARPTLGVLSGFVAPAFAGAFVAWIFDYSIRHKGTNVTVRLLVFVGAVFTVQFADVYAAAFRRTGVSLGPTLAPNATFIVGLVLYLVLRVDTEEGDRRSLLGLLPQRWQQRPPSTPRNPWGLARGGQPIHTPPVWRYEPASGQVVGSQTARNALCPCGSGRKLKRCHGAPGGALTEEQREEDGSDDA